MARARLFVLGTLLSATAACATIVGIHDVTEDTPEAGTDAATVDQVPGDGGAHVDAEGGRVDAASDAGVDARPGADASVDATTEAGVDAGPLATLTGGQAHFLQEGEQVGLSFVANDGTSKAFIVSANGNFELPEPARSVLVATPPAGKRCWSRADGATRVDVRCVYASRVVPEPSQTSSGVFTPLLGAESTVVTDLPSTTLFIAFSMPYATTSEPLANDLSTLYARAIVDNDPTKSIELTRGSTYYHQPWNQTLLGTIDVGPGKHKVAVEYRHYVPHAVSGRAAVIGGSFGASTFPAELLTVALDSIETYDRTVRAPMTSDFTLPHVEANQWKSMSTLSDTTVGARKAVVMAYYPEVFFTSPGTEIAGFFSLMSGLDGNSTLVTHTMRHLQDANGYRSISLIAPADVNGPFAFRVDQRTELGPNVASVAPRGAGMTAMLFSSTAKIHSVPFSADADFAGGIGHDSVVPGTTFQVQTTGRALVFLDVNLVNTTTGAGELRLLDTAGGTTTQLMNGIVQSWGFEYGQGCNMATIAELSGGLHQLSLHVRPLSDTTVRVRHGLVPDGRGRSLVTIIPLE